MEDNRKPTKDVQNRIDACDNVVNWASEDTKHRGCIILATDEKSSTCAVFGRSRNLVEALVSALRETPSLRDILSTVLILDLMAGGSKNDTDKDK